jgi:hypothetical protein
LENCGKFPQLLERKCAHSLRLVLAQRQSRSGVYDQQIQILLEQRQILVSWSVTKISLVILLKKFSFSGGTGLREEVPAAAAQTRHQTHDQQDQAAAHEQDQNERLARHDIQKLDHQQAVRNRRIRWFFRHRLQPGFRRSSRNGGGKLFHHQIPLMHLILARPGIR